MAPVHINSAAQFRSLLASSTIVIADFYADWCGPCKAIAPLYESLSAKHSSPSMTFTKINVDSQSDLARTYGVTAMPTFLVFKAGAVINTLRGADPRALTAAVDAAAKMAGERKVPLYKSKGHTLGGAPSTGRRAGLGRPVSWTLGGWVNAVVTFLGLYFVSLFSLDPYISAQRSMFNIHAEPPKPANKTTTGGRASGSAPAGRKVGTLADLGAN